MGFKLPSWALAAIGRGQPQWKPLPGVVYHSPNACACETPALFKNELCTPPDPLTLNILPCKSDPNLLQSDHDLRRRDLFRFSKHLIEGCDCCLPLTVDEKTRRKMLVVLGINHTIVGANLSSSFFAGSPQQNAIFNMHLVDYFNGRSRAQETTHYNVPSSQHHILQSLGMEIPNPDAPETRHALHKNIEEDQLHRLRGILPANNYGLISVKAAKFKYLPPAASVQNPHYEAKDPSRYPGSGVRDSNFRDHPIYLMHDVSSVVGPHELVERMVKDNPEVHLIVTGMNPIEVLDGESSFEPASHTIEYDLSDFTYVFTGSESESYNTPIGVTKAWLRTSSVKASNGTVYHVTLLEEKLGHCIWHIFCGDVESQHTRTFSTGSYTRIPYSLSGTAKDEYINTKLITGILDFDNRAKDHSYSNMAAKVSQLGNSISPRTTARERWIATHVAQVHHFPYAPLSWQQLLQRGFWNFCYVVTFQWQMFAPVPDTYSLIDERKRTRIIHPTPGGGWSSNSLWKSPRDSIPNNPSMLQRLSAFTGSVFTFLIPKLLLGEVLSTLFMHVDFLSALRHLYHWTDISWPRATLTLAVLVVASVLPGNITKIFSRLSGHFWRQLWLPGWTKDWVERILVEISGAPGHRFFKTLPGRGWGYQFVIWSIGVHSVLPGLIPSSILPWKVAAGILFHFSLTLPGAYMLTLCIFVLAEQLAWYIGNPNLVPLPFPERLSDLILVHNWPVLISQARNSLNRLVLWYSGIVSTGNCGRIPILPVVPEPPKPTQRRRQVDITLPARLVQPSNIPTGPVGIALAVSPAGLEYAEWTRAVQRAYQQQPNAYPQLIPGRSCFFDCVSKYYGTPHMWYSWYMAYFQIQVSPNQRHGEMDFQKIQNFCAASKFGLNVTGITKAIQQSPDASWPTLNLKLSYAAGGDMHVEIAKVEELPDAINALARVMRTCAGYGTWMNEILAHHNNAPVDTTPEPTEFLLACLGTRPAVTSYNEVGTAIVSSVVSEPIPAPPANMDGFSFPVLQGLPTTWNFPPVAGLTYPALFNYKTHVSNATIAAGAGDGDADFRFPGRVSSRQKVQERFGRFGETVVSALARNRFSKLADEVLKTKVGAGRAQRADNAARNNEVPRPPRWTELQQELSASLSDYIPVTLPRVPLEREDVTFTVDIQRAARFASDLRSNPSELRSLDAFPITKSLDAIVDCYKLLGKTVSIPVVAYMGIGGCGKTTATRQFLMSLTPDERRKARVVTYSEELRAEAQLRLDFPEMRGYNFPTIRNLILEPSAGYIIYDDAGKFWGGLIDLVTLANPLSPGAVVNGDPAQGYEGFPVAGTQSLHDPSALAVIAQMTTKYATEGHRLPQLHANTLGVYTTSTQPGFITHSVGPKIDIPVCTSSDKYAKVLQVSGRQSYTFGSVQGKDFDTEIEADMTGLEGSVLDRTAYVALTRSKVGTYVRLQAADPASTIKAPPTGSDIMNALVYEMRASNVGSLLAPSSLVKAAFYRHLHWSMPRLPWFATIGASVPASEFQHVIPATNETFVSEVSAADSVPVFDVPHATPAFDNLVPEFHITAKEYREVSTEHGQTNQFKETDFVNPQVHTRGDTATYHLSRRARLRPCVRAANIKRYETSKRKDMIDEFVRLVPNPPRWTDANFDGYVDKAIDEYLSKRTVAAVIKKLQDHDPDRTPSNIKISLKGQVIKKTEKMSKGAIPGQLIHEYDIAQTLADSSFALWLEDHLPDAFPSTFLFYRRMDPAEFIKAYSARWRVNNGAYASDVTRWDVGCDAGMVNFDEFVMRYIGFPSWYVDAYVERRLSSFSQHGPMATMQNSGDRYTWILNSIRRAVVTSIVCDLTAEDTAAINGDDAAIDRFASAKPFPDSPWLFKDENAQRVEFSGFTLGGTTPLYSAHGLWYRTCILMSRDPSAQEKWESYLNLLSYADLDSPYAATIARHAQTHMNPDKFWQHLPKPLHNYISSVSQVSFSVYTSSLYSTLSHLFTSLPLSSS